MRLFLLPLLALTLFAVAPEAQAQRGGERSGTRSTEGSTMSWYLIKLGDRTETVRASAVRIETKNGRRTVKADRRSYAADAEIVIVLVPTEGDERPTRGDLARVEGGVGPWVFHQPPVSAQNESGTTTTTTTSTSPDGKYETTTTTTSTPSSDGSPPTTTSSTTIKGTGK